MAKQFAFYQIGWQGSTIDFNKRLLGTKAVVVY